MSNLKTETLFGMSRKHSGKRRKLVKPPCPSRPWIYLAKSVALVRLACTYMQSDFVLHSPTVLSLMTVTQTSYYANELIELDNDFFSISNNCRIYVLTLFQTTNFRFFQT